MAIGSLRHMCEQINKDIIQEDFPMEKLSFYAYN